MNSGRLVRGCVASAVCSIALALAACGEDSKPSITDPVEVPESVVGLTAGHYHSCGLSEEGVAFCWGYNSVAGQLGDGTNVNRINPVAVVGDLRFQSLTGGGFHTCGIATGGSAYCWGANEFGALGNGVNVSENKPVAVSGGLAFISISAGESHTCGLTPEGAYCWGKNDRGQLGNGNVVPSNVPVPVQGGLAFQSIKAGYEHTCGLIATGEVYCWGKNTSGQLGDGTKVDSSEPVAVAGGLTFATLGGEMGANGGQNHTCGITVDKIAYCWGDNWHNQVGSTELRGSVLTPGQVVGLPAVDRIAIGGDHSCALTAAGEAWCWGDTTRGQLGREEIVGSEFHAPVVVSGEHTFTGLSLGWDHSCAVNAEGDAYCWGYNGHGQLGNGTRDNGVRPELVVFE